MTHAADLQRASNMRICGHGTDGMRVVSGANRKRLEAIASDLSGIMPPVLHIPADGDLRARAILQRSDGRRTAPAGAAARSRNDWLAQYHAVFGCWRWGRSCRWPPPSSAPHLTCPRRMSRGAKTGTDGPAAQLGPGLAGSGDLLLLRHHVDATVHMVAFCGDIGIGPTHGAAALSTQLAIGFVAQQSGAGWPTV